jgi:hypothetical protein
MSTTPARADSSGAAGDSGRGPTISERVESSPLGRSIISAFLIFTLGAMIASNLPPSELRRTALKAASPFLDLTGLHQNWNLFAPDPRRVTLQLEARITYADGTNAVWHPPVGDPFVGVYRTFRWRKWAGYVVAKTSASLWAPTAAWVARTHVRGGVYPARVVLVRRFYVAPLPGRADTRQPPWNETVLYTARFTASGARI